MGVNLSSPTLCISHGDSFFVVKRERAPVPCAYGDVIRGLLLNFYAVCYDV